MPFIRLLCFWYWIKLPVSFLEVHWQREKSYFSTLLRGTKFSWYCTSVRNIPLVPYYTVTLLVKVLSARLEMHRLLGASARQRFTSENKEVKKRELPTLVIHSAHWLHSCDVFHGYELLDGNAGKLATYARVLFLPARFPLGLFCLCLCLSSSSFLIRKEKKFR